MITECIYCGGVIGQTCFDPQGHQIAAESASYRREHHWYTPQVEAAHKILCDAADHLDTTERRLANGDIAQAVSNLAALRIEINNAFDLLTGALKSDAEIVLGVFRSEQPQQVDPPCV